MSLMISQSQPFPEIQHENMSNVDDSAAISSEVHLKAEKTFYTTNLLSALPGCYIKMMHGLHQHQCVQLNV